MPESPNIEAVMRSTSPIMDVKQEQAQDAESKISAAVDSHTTVDDCIDISSDYERAEDDSYADQAEDNVAIDSAHPYDGPKIKLEMREDEVPTYDFRKSEDVEDAASSSALTPIPPYDWQALYEDFDVAMRKQHEMEQEIQNETQRLMQVRRCPSQISWRLERVTTPCNIVLFDMGQHATYSRPRARLKTVGAKSSVCACQGSPRLTLLAFARVSHMFKSVKHSLRTSALTVRRHMLVQANHGILRPLFFTILRSESRSSVSKCLGFA